MPPTPHPSFAGELAADSYGATADRRPPLVLLHGLGGRRQHWSPVLRELASIDADRRVLVPDLPGHGGSPRSASYRLDQVTPLLHDALRDAELEAPVMVGHSIGAVVATAYAAVHPAGAVVNVDQPLLAGGFRDVLLRAEPVLRSPDYLDVWRSLQVGMGIDLLPSAARRLLAEDPAPTQDLLLGYWHELMETPADVLTADRERELATLRARHVAYHHISAEPLPEGYRSWLEAALLRLTLTVLPGGGHFLHLAHPARVAEILAGTSGPRGREFDEGARGF